MHMKKIIWMANLVIISVLVLGSAANFAEAKTSSATPKNTAAQHKKVAVVKKKAVKKKITKKTKAAVTKSKILSAPLIDPNNPPGGR